MKIRTLRKWTTRSGQERVVRLYNAWRNLKARTRGTARAGNGRNYWKGKPVEWQSFEEFREWALANGYSRTRNSLDRKDDTQGYTRANCRWLTVAQNTAHENACRAARRQGGQVSISMN